VVLGPLGKEEFVISKKKKAAPVDRASPTIRRPTTTDATRVVVTRDVTSAAQKNPGWQNATDLQAAAKAWNQAANDIEANATVVTAARTTLRVAEAKQLGLRRTWRAAKKQVLSTADVLCAGSADDLKAYGFDVLTRAALGLPIAVPGNLSTTPGTALGDAVVKWPRGDARHGFVVQHASDVANAATYSLPFPCTKCSFTLSGLTSGSVTHFRVAAIDPSSATGTTAWSGWVSGTAR
jgi:hypothetical protein